MRGNNFDREGFMKYLADNFNGFENRFLRELVENIIEYAEEHKNVSLNQFAYFVSDMLPEIEFGEVAMFCDDDMLTETGKRLKRGAEATHDI